MMCVTVEVVFEEVDAAFCFGEGASDLHNPSDENLRVWGPGLECWWS